MHGRVDESPFIVAINDELLKFLANSLLNIVHISVIPVNENENEIYEKRSQNEFVNEN